MLVPRKPFLRKISVAASRIAVCLPGERREPWRWLPRFRDEGWRIGVHPFLAVTPDRVGQSRHMSGYYTV